LILIPLTQKGFLVPKKIWDFTAKDKWEKEWKSNIVISDTLTDKKISLAKAWTPYAVIVLILIITRVNFLPFSAFIKSVKLSIPPMFGTTVRAELDYLNNPGFFPFLPIALLCIPFFRLTWKQTFTAWSEVAKRIKSPLISLFFAVPMVQIMMISGTNSKEFVSIPLALAQFMESVFHNAWPLVDPFVGALGAFMSGSTTVSNMLFSMFQYSIAGNLGISHILTVSLQNVGGSFGNMINVQKIITACAVVGLTGVEGLIIKRTITPMIIAILLAGIVGLLLVFLLIPGLF
jgi:lactate permease